MQEYDLGQPILDLRGKPIKTEDKEVMTYQDAILEVLGYIKPEDASNAELKRKCFKMGILVASKKKVKLSPKQVAFLIDRFEKVGSSITLGRLEQLFDSVEDDDLFGDEEQEEKKASKK